MYEVCLSYRYLYEFLARLVEDLCLTLFIDDDDIFRVDYTTNVKKYKKDNDHLLQMFADGFSITGLTPFSGDIFHCFAIPTLVEFTDRPQKQYLEYLHRFIWWGRPFVGRPYGKNKGVWKRGSIFYTLPEFLASPCRRLLASPSLRKKLNLLFR